MKNINLLDVLWRIGLAVWVGISIYCFVSGNSDLFPRMGAMLVAIAVGYFALMPDLDPYPSGLAELSHIMSKQINLNASSAHLALQNTSVLAASTKKALVDGGLSYPSSISELAKPIMENQTRHNHEVDWAGYDQKSLAISLKREEASKTVAKLRSQNHRVQAVIVVIGTLQWGFGDLLFKSLCEGMPC